MIHVYEELGDTSRRRLLSELRAGPKTVTELVLATFLKQPNVSNHLSRMKTKGILRAEKVGRQVFYSFASSQVEAVINSAFAESNASGTRVDLEESAKRFAKAATQGNEAVCSEILDQAFADRLSLLDIYQDLIVPAMLCIGNWYRDNAIDAAQEHMASAVAERMMARAVGDTVPARRQDRTALLGCGPNSSHLIGLRMVADYLSLCGWRTVFLGANVPHKYFLEAVEQNKPDLVLLSCVAEGGLGCGLALIKALKERRTPKDFYVIGVGGHCVGTNRDQFLSAGADFTCANLRSFATEYLPAIEKTGRVPSAK